jgi:hypothetical protein
MLRGSIRSPPLSLSSFSPIAPISPIPFSPLEERGKIKRKEKENGRPRVTSVINVLFFSEEQWLWRLIIMIGNFAVFREFRGWFVF